MDDQSVTTECIQLKPPNIQNTPNATNPKLVDMMPK